MSGSEHSPHGTFPDGLTETDRARIERHGLDLAEVSRQLRLLRHEPPPIQLDRPCTVGDGILRLSEQRHAALQDRFQAAAAAGRFAKFVPASGAATRMFRGLLAARNAGTLKLGSTEADEAKRFLSEMGRFPFRDLLSEVLNERGLELDELARKAEAQSALEALLDEATDDAPALGFGSYPKALIPFHATDSGPRTPLDEHVEEAAEHLRSHDGVCSVHFTIPQHRELEFRQAFRDIVARLEARLGGRYELSCSIQRPSTDTVAVRLAEDGSSELAAPLRDEEGRLLFRPGGHGALLVNLGEVVQETGADLVFLRTIDNVLPAAQRREVLLWNRLLGGYLLELEQGIVQHLGALERAERAGSVGESEVDAGLRFAAERLNLAHALDYLDRPLRVKHAWLVDRLDRPLRVCGMVKNEGEPGGGPFWVRHVSSDSEVGQVTTPQIVEQAQVNRRDPQQTDIAGAATHFNPVNMVCRLRSHRGDPYDLASFVDPDTVFLSNKSHQGQPIRVLERPGLWNGAMARWNTVFVEIPASIFAPVKTVFDLLRPAHQPSAR